MQPSFRASYISYSLRIPSVFVSPSLFRFASAFESLAIYVCLFCSSRSIRNSCYKNILSLRMHVFVFRVSTLDGELLRVLDALYATCCLADVLIDYECAIPLLDTLAVFPKTRRRLASYPLPSTQGVVWQRFDRVYLVRLQVLLTTLTVPQPACAV